MSLGGSELNGDGETAHGLLDEIQTLTDDILEPQGRIPLRMHAEFYRKVATLRSLCAVAPSTRYGGVFALTQYEDIRAAFMDPEAFSSVGASFASIDDSKPLIPIEVDPPAHTKYRKLLSPFFSPGRILAYEDQIRQDVDNCIDRFIRRGEAEIISELASPVPIYAVARVLGLSADEVIGSQRIMMAFLDAMGSANAEALGSALAQLEAFTGDVVDSRLQTPREDLISTLIQIDMDGRTLTRDELMTLIFVLAVAGHMTSTSAIANMVLHLNNEPSDKARLIGDPALISSACEEILRLEPPASPPGRIAKSDVVVKGDTIPVGSKVALLIGSANRDEAEFPNGDRFVVDRSPNRHLSFGAGIHLCLGMHLARLELRLVLERVLARMPDYRVKEAITVERNVTIVSRDLIELPVRFTPGVPLRQENEALA